MKTAREWFKVMTDVLNEPPSWHDWIKQIQLDAYKAGMTDAAEIAGSKIHEWQGESWATQRMAACKIEMAIQAARDKKTPTDLK